MLFNKYFMILKSIDIGFSLLPAAQKKFPFIILNNYF
jgi:hypothetical protein